jgi:hypothetical protein
MKGRLKRKEVLEDQDGGGIATPYAWQLHGLCSSQAHSSCQSAVCFAAVAEAVVVAHLVEDEFAIPALHLQA